VNKPFVLFFIFTLSGTNPGSVLRIMGFLEQHLTDGLHKTKQSSIFQSQVFSSEQKATFYSRDEEKNSLID
jgi:hypothetical protein